MHPPSFDLSGHTDNDSTLLMPDQPLVGSVGPGDWIHQLVYVFMLI
jgi:hypothetical protein